ncbi:MAG: hypothetical protein F6K24_20575 [Okeania sp. SIO2D1]|nr:hypothetical protein [Okeania sp. SIO2D1]
MKKESGKSGWGKSSTSHFVSYTKSGSIGVIRWGVREIGRWGDGEMGSERNIW